MAIEAYNNTIHTTTGVVPNEALNPREKAKIMLKYIDRDIKHIEHAEPQKYKKGDLVRLKKAYKNAFVKSGDPKWSQDYYRIQSAINSKPQPSYVLETRDGSTTLPASIIQSHLQ